MQTIIKFKTYFLLQSEINACIIRKLNNFSTLRDIPGEVHIVRPFLTVVFCPHPPPPPRRPPEVRGGSQKVSEGFLPRANNVQTTPSSILDP